MKSKIISTLKFVGLHAFVGGMYFSFLYLIVILEKNIDIELFSNVGYIIGAQFDNVHLIDWACIFIMDTFMTLAVIDKFSIYKGKFKIIKRWIAWIVGIIIAYNSGLFMLMLYWLI